MTVEIISIGDELLIGQTINTNASWMGTALGLIGAQVEYGTVIRDGEDDIFSAFETAMNRVDVVLVTGGLGPTKDDITKHVLCNYFDAKLVRNESVLEHVQSFFESRGRVMLDVNVAQADVPDKSIALHNPNGTAPGMWFERDGKVLVSMPGVPYEMKGIMTSEVLPRLKELFQLDALFYRTIQTQGIGESYIADRIEDLESEMHANDISLAYLPSPGSVRLRLSSKATRENELKINGYVDQISELMPQYVFGYGNASLEKVIGDLFKDNKLKLGTVESCTGGAIASAITSVEGSSTFFEGSIVSYTADVKKDLVNVEVSTIEKNGLVSQQVAEEMAVNGKKILKTDYCIAVTGNAGPTTNENKEGVGVVWIAIAGNERVLSKRFQFENDRNRNIRRSVLTSLNLLRCELMKINIEKS